MRTFKWLGLVLAFLMVLGTMAYAGSKDVDWCGLCYDGADVKTQVWKEVFNFDPYDALDGVNGYESELIIFGKYVNLWNATAYADTTIDGGAEYGYRHGKLILTRRGPWGEYLYWDDIAVYKTLYGADNTTFEVLASSLNPNFKGCEFRLEANYRGNPKTGMTYDEKYYIGDFSLNYFHIWVCCEEDMICCEPTR